MSSRELDAREERTHSAGMQTDIFWVEVRARTVCVIAQLDHQVIDSFRILGQRESGLVDTLGEAIVGQRRRDHIISKVILIRLREKWENLSDFQETPGPCMCHMSTGVS